MKCGHLFGHQCIYNWFGKSRTALCPSCSQLGKKSELRNIFATSVKLMDDTAEQQIMEKYLKAKELKDRYEEQTKHLMISLEYMQMELRGLERMNRELLISDKKNVQEEYVYELYKKILLKATYAILLIDKITQNILISYRDTRSVGFLKMEYTYDSPKYIFALTKSPDAYFINDFKLSPWEDGYILIAYDKTVKMMNSNTGNEIIAHSIEDKIKCVCFNLFYRNLFHFCDANGFMYTYDIDKIIITHKIMVDANSHSIVALRDIIIVASFGNWYKLYVKENHVLEKQDIPLGMHCIHVSLYDNYLFFNLQLPNKRSKLVIYQINKRESEINNYLVLGTPSYLQTKAFLARKNYKFFNGILFLVNNSKNTIEFYCIKISEKIVEFDVAEERIIILGTSNLFIFNRESSNFATIIN